MEFLISFQNENTAAELGCPRNGSHLKDLMEHLPPKTHPAELGDSAVISMLVALARSS